MGGCSVSSPRWPMILPTLCNEDPIRALDTKAWGSFLADEHINVLRRVMCPGSMGRGDGSLHLGSFQTSHYVSVGFTWLVLICILYNETVIENTFLSSVNHSSELLNMSGGHGNLPVLQPVDQKQWPGNLQLHCWHLKLEGSLIGDHALQPVVVWC